MAVFAEHGWGVKLPHFLRQKGETESPFQRGEGGRPELWTRKALFSHRVATRGAGQQTHDVLCPMSLGAN